LTTTDLPKFQPDDQSPTKPQSSDNAVLAGFGSRLLALTIDLAILTISLYIATGAAAASYRITHNAEVWGSVSFYLYAYLFYNLFAVVYFVFFIADMGQTPGKAAVGIKVVNMFRKETGFGRALFRTFGYYLSSFFLMAGFLWYFFDRSHQTWHDKLAGTIVVEI
jgi:uncharacterized RDD family membrane protein YckC